MTRQTPIGSGFGAASTAMEVVSGIDLSRQLAIVTGGASGLGLETTRALIHAGAHVIVSARDPERASFALRALKGATVERMNLADPRSVATFADRVVSTAGAASTARTATLPSSTREAVGGRASAPGLAIRTRQSACGNCPLIGLDFIRFKFGNSHGRRQLRVLPLHDRG
jgi:NAD(P)-dependent dehydrogenase (short-subunit alcohol dehydrogenase family)